MTGGFLPHIPHAEAALAGLKETSTPELHPTSPTALDVTWWVILQHGHSGNTGLAMEASHLLPNMMSL